MMTVATVLVSMLHRVHFSPIDVGGDAEVGRLLAYSCHPAYVQRHVHIHTVRADRLFGGGQKQGQASEPMEVGNLSRWEIKRSGAVSGIFPDDGGGQ
jgi:hypothetical protein